jgi:ABC-2 type transport system ATP-binding protein
MNIVEVKNFSKSFGKLKAVNDLSFEVKEGEVFAFLGANGSGKTTTLRALLGIYTQDEGELTIFGKPYTTNDSNLIGYLPEERGLYLNSTVEEILMYFGELKGLNREESKERALEYLGKVDLVDKFKMKINKLSSGQQQKIQLGITLINNPKLLILDEPTKGLDPINRKLFMDIFMEMKQKGSTIIFSTHQLDEVERIADRVLIIQRGIKREYGEVETIKSKYAKDSYSVRSNKEIKLDESVVEVISKSGHEAVIKPRKGISQSELFVSLTKDNAEILSIEKNKISLNDIFIKVNQE